MNSIRKNMNYSPSLLPCHTNVLHNQVWLCSGLTLRLHSKLFSSQKLVILSLSLTSNLEASIFTSRKSSQQPKRYQHFGISSFFLLNTFERNVAILEDLEYSYLIMPGTTLIYLCLKMRILCWLIRSWKSL